MTTQKESEAIYNASRENIYYNLILDLRDLGYKPKAIAEITAINANTLRGQLYKARKSEPKSGLNFLIETLLNYTSIMMLLDKANKNTLLSTIENLQDQLKSIEDGIQLSLTEADIEEKVGEITKELEASIKTEETPNPVSPDFDPEYPGSTEEAPFGFNQDGSIRKIPPRKSKRKRRS